ncbi:NusA-like transcription termination signal-binding factor [Candidatus Woesearchaeota archaeon]|nr:NusA-like transcription termination signal-binding factor [Candidatus Woesearchaeota archaeon]
MDSKITYGMETLGLMKLFENMTKAKIRDCIVDEEKIIFVVQEGELRKALGKGAENIKKLSEKLNKKVKIAEFADEMLALIKNFINPLKVDEIYEENGIVILKSSEMRTKGIIIGRNAKNLRALENNIRRYFPDLKEIKVM